MSPRQTSTHVDSPVALGARLLDARRQAGLTQQQLSFSGCSTGYISRLEQGGRVPSLQVVFELARRLGVSPQWLSRGVDEAPPETAERDDLLNEAELALRLDETGRARELYEVLSPTRPQRSRHAPRQASGSWHFRKTMPRRRS